MLTSLPPLLELARRKKFAIPAFNVTNLETAQAVLAAAVSQRSPVILQASESALAYAGDDVLLHLMELVADRQARSVPVVTHLDHGKHVPIVRRCIMLGFKSVHMDASARTWSENVTVTKQAVRLGHARHIAVQGELGALLGHEGMTGKNFSRKDIERLMTDPSRAADFVRRTGIDTLAVAVGTAHGAFRGKEKIDFKRLLAIYRTTKVPLVLHGGSGVADREIRKAIAVGGIRIINLDTTLRLQFVSGLAKSVASFDPKAKVDLRAYLTVARTKMELEAARLIRLLGSAGKAR
jgi:ketose-bisphosphate aldolase